MGRSERAAPGASRIVMILVAIYALAWIARFMYVLHLRSSPLAEVPTLDEFYHVEWAQMLAAGDWIGSDVFFRAPLYPYLLGVSFVLSRGSLFASRIFQVTYGALTPVALYFLGRRVFDRRVGLVAAAVAALYPFFIYFDHELLIVSLIVLLDVVLLVALLRADSVPSWGRWTLAGVVLGASAIARPNVLVVVPFVLLWIWWGARSEPAGEASVEQRVSLLFGSTPLRTTLRRFAALALGAALVVAPVTLRNYVLGRDFVPIASQGGVNFFIGNNEEADGIAAVLPALGESWRYEDAVRIAELDTGRRLKPSEASGYWYAKGREFIVRNPGASARLFMKKLVLFWNSFELANNKDVYHFGNMSWVFRGLSWLHFGVIAPFAILGMWVFTRRNRAAALVTLFVLSYMGGVLLFFINARYRLPVVPFLILFGTAAAFWLVERLRKRDVRTFAIGAAAVAVLALLVNLDYYGTHVGERAQTHYTIGLARASQGDHEAAVESYLRAIELSPGYARAYNNMGIALEKLARDEEALEAYHTAGRLDRTLASAPNNIGIYYWQREEHEEAARWFAEALERDPYLEQAHYNLATMLVFLGDPAAAEEHFKSAIVARRDYKEAWNALGRVVEEAGRPSEAIRAYSNAVAIDPGFGDARNNLAIVLAQTGQYEEALRELGIALRCTPGDPKIKSNIEAVRTLMRKHRSGSPVSP